MNASPIHRESRPPLDLADVMLRVAERRAYVANNLLTLGQSHREIVTADTDLLEACALEIARVRSANDAQSIVIKAMGKRA